MKSKALVIIDLQKDYQSKGAFPLPSIDIAVQNTKVLLEWAREEGIRVVHVRHEELDCESEFLVKGTPGTEIIECVFPIEGEPIITKYVPNAFRDTNLNELLEGTNEIIFSGAMSNLCIDATDRAAFDLGYEVTIAHNACAACELEFEGETISANLVHGAFMAAFAAGYGKVLPVEELIKSV